MALLDNGLKQRIVGALVLLALAVIFLPMLLSRQDDLRHVVVDAPSMPQSPGMPVVEMQPATVPEREVPPQEPVPEDPIGEFLEDRQGVAVAQAPVDQSAAAPAQVPSAQAPSSQASSQAAASPAQKPTTPPQPAGKLDGDGVPVSWSVQLASLSSRSGAENLQKTLRTQGYNAYIRSADGMNRVFVGPLIERAEADRLRDQLKRQQKLDGLVVRFQPESG